MPEVTMFLLNYVKPEEATGKVAEIYEKFPKEVSVPLPLQLSSASPGLLAHQMNFIGYFMQHEKLSFPLLTAIRYVCATECAYDYCTGFNKNLLMAQGMTETELETLKSDPESSPLEDPEKKMLKFVMKAVKDPKSVGKSDIEELRSAGWADSDIFDALAHGTNMISAGIINQAFTQ